MPHQPQETNDRKMKRFVTASESNAVTVEGISNTIYFSFDSLHKSCNDRGLTDAPGTKV